MSDIITRPRLTLQQFAALAATSDPSGCSRCGCKDSREMGGFTAGGKQFHKRACRNCGHQLPSVEVAKRAAVAPPPQPIEVPPIELPEIEEAPLIEELAIEPEPTPPPAKRPRRTRRP